MVCVAIELWLTQGRTQMSHPAAPYPLHRNIEAGRYCLDLGYGVGGFEHATFGDGDMFDNGLLRRP